MPFYYLAYHMAVNLDLLQSLLAGAGLDLLQPFAAQTYNAAAKDGLMRLNTYNRKKTLAVVIGNTRTLWKPFVADLARCPEHIASEAPLDDYVQSAVQKALTQAATCKHAVHLSADLSPETFIDIMTAAHVAGLAYYNRDLHLCIRTEYGAWIALRAVVVFDEDYLGEDSPQLSDPCPESRSIFREQMQELMASAASGSWEERWEEWAALRRAAGPLHSREHEYGQLQLAYHYTKSKEVLRQAVQLHLGERV